MALRRVWRGRLLCAAAFGVLGWLGCGPSESGPLGETACTELVLPEPRARANLVLVVNDTMRRDAPGVYGGDARTPAFDRFASEHLLFQNAYTQSPWTKPSIATLFTSLHPSQHGVESDPQMRDDKQREGPFRSVDVLPEPLVTLAEVLGGAGHATAGFVTNPWIEGRVGFGQGFDLWDDSAASWESGGGPVVDAALAWLADRGADEPFFLYVHLIDSHRPYGRVLRSELAELRRAVAGSPAETGPEAEKLLDDLRADDGTPLRRLGFRPSRALFRAVYRMGVEAFDPLLARLLEGLRAHPAWERTAVVVTSDHGEALFDRGYGTHGHHLHDDEAAVPLAARLPGVSPERGRVECLVGLVDLMPSFCAYLGVACPDAAQGWSFLRAPDAPVREARRWLVTEGVMRRPLHRSIRNSEFKLLYEPGRHHRESGYALYAVEEDPDERVDRLEQAPSEPTERVFDVMRRALGDATADLDLPPAPRTGVPEETRERLRELGYAEP